MKVFFGKGLRMKEGRYAYAIGAFDGLHAGHLSIVEELRKLKGRGYIPALISFFPHPDAFVKKEGIKLLFPLEERIHQFAEAGMEVVVLLKFDREIAGMEPEDFVRKVLRENLKAKYAIIGRNFTFGKEGKGNAELFLTLSRKNGIHGKVVELVHRDGEVLSSSAIRKRVEMGDVEGASRFLGYNFYIRGKVIKGDGMGRKIGFPTANLHTRWKLLPADGVYACLCDVEGKRGRFKGAANIGPRPTFGRMEKSVEVHIIDFKDDIYGRDVKLEFVKRIRDVKKFPGRDDLLRQIEEDIKRVKEVLKE